MTEIATEQIPLVVAKQGLVGMTEGPNLEACARSSFWRAARFPAQRPRLRLPGPLSDERHSLANSGWRFEFPATDRRTRTAHPE